MKTTPTETLEIALSLTSLNLGVIGAARFTAYRLNCRGEWRNTGFGQTKLEYLQKYPFTLKQYRILKEYHLVGQYEYKVLTPTREDWCVPGKFADPKV
jgi:hypothetical protein